MKAPPHPISELWKEDDGWFAILKQGWIVDGAIGVREDTKAKLLARIKQSAKQGDEE